MTKHGMFGATNYASKENFTQPLGAGPQSVIYSGKFGIMQVHIYGIFRQNLGPKRIQKEL